jgi:hypothetical protein
MNILSESARLIETERSLLRDAIPARKALTRGVTLLQDHHAPIAVEQSLLDDDTAQNRGGVFDGSPLPLV